MRLFAQILTAAVLAVTAENLIFTSGVGIGRVLRAARYPKYIFRYASMVTMFSVLSGVTAKAAAPWIANAEHKEILAPIVFAAGAACWYLFMVLLLVCTGNKLWQKNGQMISSSALNALVLAVPFMQQMKNWSWGVTIGFGIGTGIAFYISSRMISCVMPRFSHQAIPKAFRGLPATILYVGIVSLAFVGLTGGKYFF